MNTVQRDQLSYRIDDIIKNYCTEEEKNALIVILEYLNDLLKDENLSEYQIRQIENQIEKILLYNI